MLALALVARCSGLGCGEVPRLHMVQVVAKVAWQTRDAASGLPSGEVLEPTVAPLLPLRPTSLPRLCRALEQ